MSDAACLRKAIHHMEAALDNVRLAGHYAGDIYHDMLTEAVRARIVTLRGEKHEADYVAASAKS